MIYCQVHVVYAFAIVLKIEHPIKMMHLRIGSTHCRYLIYFISRFIKFRIPLSNFFQIPKQLLISPLSNRHSHIHTPSVEYNYNKMNNLMPPSIESLLNDLNAEMKILTDEIDDPVIYSKKCIEKCHFRLKEFRSYILKHKFKSESEEIYFFKCIKPDFLYPLIYYLKILKIESERPKGGREIKIKYYRRELTRLKNYFNDNLDFYIYYRNRNTFLDHKYFVRGNFDLSLALDTNFFESDTRFCTGYDLKVATILAHDKLQVYLEDKISCLKQQELIPIKKMTNHQLQWSGNKTDLVELIYSLQAHGVFDFGRSDIKKIASSFESFCNIDLGDYYHTFLEIRNRKMGRTKFIDTLKQSLEKRMFEADER